MTDQMLIADCVIDLASESDVVRHRRFVTPFLVVEFATELDEPFVYATMEVASE